MTRRELVLKLNKHEMRELAICAWLHVSGEKLPQHRVDYVFATRERADFFEDMLRWINAP